MTTEEFVAIFVGIVTAITTVVGGTIRSSRAPRLRKGIAEDLSIYQSLPSGSGARPAIREGIDRQSAELAALVLHPTRTSAFVYAFFVFLAWGVVIIVYVIEGPGPLLFQASLGRGLVNWAYLVGGVIALVLFLRTVREVSRQRAQLTGSLTGDRPDDPQRPGARPRRSPPGATMGGWRCTSPATPPPTPSSARTPSPSCSGCSWTSR